MLSFAQRQFWNENGYLILQGFFARERISIINRLIEQVWRDPPEYLIVDRTRGAGRLRLMDVPVSERNERYFKLNDLYLEEEPIRELALDARLVPVLTDLMSEPVVLCNSLNFERGSMQPEHIDSLYMTPRTPGKLVATWIALEDAHPTAGQLFYYPGSHRIPRYRFSDGSHHSIPLEQPRWHQYIREQIETLNLHREQFEAQQGDVLIWHADLVHGGSATLDPERTRRSLVSHYLSLSDCEIQKYDCVRVGEDAYWYRRSHPPLPGSEPFSHRVRVNLSYWLRRMGVYPLLRTWMPIRR